MRTRGPKRIRDQAELDTAEDSGYDLPARAIVQPRDANQAWHDPGQPSTSRLAEEADEPSDIDEHQKSDDGDADGFHQNDLPVYEDPYDDSADEYRLSQDEDAPSDDEHPLDADEPGSDIDDGDFEGQQQEDDDNEGEDDEEEDDEFPAAPDVAALRMAEQYAHPPPLAPGTGPTAISAEVDPAHDQQIPETQHAASYRARTMGSQRIEELGYYGADEEVQIEEDEIARLVAAIRANDDNTDSEFGPAQSQRARTSDKDRVENGRAPVIRKWDAAMLQERAEFEEELRGAHGMKRKRNRRVSAFPNPAGAIVARSDDLLAHMTQKQKRNAPRQQALSDEIQEMLSQANSDYVLGCHDDAIQVLHDIIRIEPYARAAWSLLMLCFRERGQEAESVQAGIILASLSNAAAAVEMFKELAESSRRLGARQQAVYCLQQAIVHSGKTDTDAMWDRALLLEQSAKSAAGNPGGPDHLRSAAEGYAMIVRLHPWDQEAKDASIRCFFERKDYRRGAALLDVVRKWMMHRFPDGSSVSTVGANGGTATDAPDPTQMEHDHAESMAQNPNLHEADSISAPEGTAAEPQQNTYTEMDLYSHVEFLLYAKEPFQAIHVLRETVRWLQGRAEDSYWDDIEYDDREFDEVRPTRKPEGDAADQQDDDDAGDDDDGRVAFDRSQDLLAAGRLLSRAKKVRFLRSSSRPGGNEHQQDDDEDEDGRNQQSGGEDNEGDETVRREESAAAATTAEDIDLIARRRQWEAWESRAPVFGLSPSLRALLGRARLMLGDEDEAERQFSIVLEHDVTVHADLFADVAQAYMEYGYWQEAFDVLAEMDRVEVLRTAQYYEWLGTCCQNLGKLRQAAVYLQGVVDARPSDLSVRYQLAEIYAGLGDNDSALRLAASLVRQGSGQAESGLSGYDEGMTEEPSNSFFSMSGPVSDMLGDPEQSASTSRETPAKKRSGRQSRIKRHAVESQRAKLEAIRELEYRAAMAKLEDLEKVLFQDGWWHPDVRFEDGNGDGDADSSTAGDVESTTPSSASTWESFKMKQRAVWGLPERKASDRSRSNTRQLVQASKDWLDIASNLIEGFKNRKGMFRRDAKAPLLAKGYGKRKPHQRDNIQSRATALMSRLQDEMADDGESFQDGENSYGLPEFRGIHFDGWCTLFMKHAFILTKSGDYETALELLRLVSSSFTMQMHDRRRLNLSLCMISCAVYARDFTNVFIEVRNLMSTYTFHDDLYRLATTLANIGGLYGLNGFMNSDLLKYFLRRIRQVHAVANGVPHSMRNGRWIIKAKFGKTRQQSNVESRSFKKVIPLGFKTSVHELVAERSSALEAGNSPAVEGDDATMDLDEGESPAAPGLADPGSSAPKIPQYASLADVRPDRPGWEGAPSGNKSVTLQEILRNGYPSRPTVVGETFYGMLMLMSRSNVPALYLFTRQYARVPTDPLLCMLCAAGFLNRALNRQVDNRHQAILQGFAYLSQYRKLRLAPLKKKKATPSSSASAPPSVDKIMSTQEVEYNFGRGFHQIGLVQQAVYHYERVLKLANEEKEAESSANGGRGGGGFWMAKEAAFNLSLIFVAGGSPSMARELYERWLVV
ncbi:transcription factor TFIIIC subunit tfc4 [Tilletia horrida]|nr:transcription factor TFIIIC subunit tfc4 [Tilletia horrida]